MTADMPATGPVVARLSFLDRFLVAWILVAMASDSAGGGSSPASGTHWRR